jgi:hypothetical protein
MMNRPPEMVGGFCFSSQEGGSKELLLLWWMDCGKNLIKLKL